MKGDVKKLQQMPWEEYYALAHKVAAELGGGGMGGFSPVADGEVLPADGFFKDDVAKNVPLMLCTTSSEFALSKENVELENIDFAGAVAMVRDQFGQANAEDILKAYQAAFPDKKPIELVKNTRRALRSTLPGSTTTRRCSAAVSAPSTAPTSATGSRIPT